MSDGITDAIRGRDTVPVQRVANQATMDAIARNPYYTSGQVTEKDKCDASMKRFGTGAVRGTDCANVRYDLITPIGLRRLAETYAEGATKHGDSNWQKGLPSRDVLCHVIAHIQKWQLGDNCEDHLAHAAWGLFTLMHNEEVRPDLIDRPYAPGFDPCKDPTNK